jgi:hypothetical protein
MQNFELPRTTAMQFGYCILRAYPHGLADRSLPQTPVASGLGHVEYHGFGAPYAAAHQSGFWQFAAEHNCIYGSWVVRTCDATHALPADDLLLFPLRSVTFHSRRSSDRSCTKLQRLPAALTALQHSMR